MWISVYLLTHHLGHKVTLHNKELHQDPNNYNTNPTLVSINKDGKHLVDLTKKTTKIANAMAKDSLSQSLLPLEFS